MCIRDSAITDKGVEHLTTALINSNCKLNSLGLECVQITDKGVEHLITALINSNCKLRNLKVISGITDKGVNHLTRALANNNCKLKSLSLHGLVVSEKSKILINDAAKDKNCAVFFYF